MGNNAIPLTIALGSPAGGLVLYLYTKSIKKYGSRYTLRISNSLCSLLLGAMTLLWCMYSSAFKSTWANYAIISFYAFREIYVSLLSTQQWAFIASHLEKANSSYLVTFTGLVSIASAVGGFAVEQLVTLGGVKALLVASFVSIIMTYACSEIAYFILNKAGNESYTLHPSKSVQSLVSFIGSKLPPMRMIMSSNNIRDSIETCLSSSTKSQSSWSQKSAFQGMSHYYSRALGIGRYCLSKTQSSFSPRRSESKDSFTRCDGKSSGDSSESSPDVKPAKKTGFWHDSWSLFCQHSILRLLFIEAITHQTCTNMLNLMFHNGLGLEVGEDSVRAMLVGRFFATVNITACVLQCFILPSLLSQSTLPNVLSTIPFIVFVAVMLGVVYPGLISVMLGFGTIKVLEYSIMTAASEMIYMPMGHDVRYVGKELIKFFGHKLGKSAASLVLSACVAHMRPSLATQSMWGACFAVCWGMTMYSLSQYLIEREKADQASKTTKVSTGVEEVNGVNAMKKEATSDAQDHRPIGKRLEQVRNRGDHAFQSIAVLAGEKDLVCVEGKQTQAHHNSEIEFSDGNITSASASASASTESSPQSCLAASTSLTSQASMESMFSAVSSRGNTPFKVNGRMSVIADGESYSPTQDYSEFFEGGICVDADDEEEKIVERVVGCEFLTGAGDGAEFEQPRGSSGLRHRSGAVPSHRYHGTHGNGNISMKHKANLKRSPKAVKKISNCSSNPVLLRIGSSQISLNSLQKSTCREY